MKFGDDLYGWGVFNIPIERQSSSGSSPESRQKALNAEPLRQLWRDVPWKRTGACILLTFLCLGVFLFLNRKALQPPFPSEPQPVKIAFRIFEEVPAVPLPIPEKKVRTAEKTPEPIRIQPPPADIQLPSPPSLLAPRSEPRPLRQVQGPSRQEAGKTELPEPSRSSYEQRRETASADLPKRTASLRNEAASVKLGEGPRRRPAAERGTQREALPGSTATALKPSDEIDLKDAAPRMNARYENLADSPDVPAPPPRGAGAPGSGGEADIRLPKATAFVEPGPRKAFAMPPPAERGPSFAGMGRTADPDLTGPAVQRSSLPELRPAPDASENSYELLDLVGREELDRSVMVSLNRLRTCLDPNEELTLKTRLASLLSRPGQCRSGGVVFDIRHPESAYSIHIDLYNYEQREFQDRCSALRLAVYSCEARR